MLPPVRGIFICIAEKLWRNVLSPLSLHEYTKSCLTCVAPNHPVLYAHHFMGRWGAGRSGIDVRFCAAGVDASSRHCGKKKGQEVNA